jgi:uncharacterized surface protein with fasciclin (FAS1) repeats
MYWSSFFDATHFLGLALPFSQPMSKTIAGNMKNTKLFYSSPFVLLGMLMGLSGPVNANPSSMKVAAEVAEVPVTPLPEPAIPSIDELTTDEAPPKEMPAKEVSSEAAPTEEVSSEATPTEGVPTPDDSTSSDTSAQTVVDVASSNEAFSTLVSAIDAAGLKETLMAEGAFTVFAPTNQAFEALPPGVLDTLLKPENKAILVKVLTHHVLGEKKMAADLSTQAETSLAKSTLQVTVNETGVVIDEAKVLQADIPASNGVIHVIDQVLIPEGLR